MGKNIKEEKNMVWEWEGEGVRRGNMYKHDNR